MVSIASQARVAIKNVTASFFSPFINKVTGLAKMSRPTMAAESTKSIKKATPPQIDGLLPNKALPEEMTIAAKAV